MALTTKEVRILKLYISSILDVARSGAPGRDPVSEVFELVTMSAADARLKVRAHWLDLRMRMATSEQDAIDNAARLAQQQIDMDPTT